MQCQHRGKTHGVGSKGQQCSGAAGKATVLDVCIRERDIIRRKKDAERKRMMGRHLVMYHMEH